MARSERMDPIDTTWLRMDRPANRMIIVGVIMLAQPVDIGRIETTLAKRLLTYRRFRQRVEYRATGIWWCDDPHFDIAHHIKRFRLPSPGGKVELQRYVAELAARPLDPAHPLWEYQIVEDYEQGAVLIARIHHAIADGIALINQLLSLTDDRPNAPLAGRRRSASADDDLGMNWPEALRTTGEIIGTGLRLSNKAWDTAITLATHPTKAVDYLRDGTGITSELAYLLFMPMDTPTRLKGTPLGDKRVAWSDPIPLPEVKAVSRALGCSVNDMLLAAVSGALKSYLEDKGDPTEGVEVRALVPINLRPPTGGPTLGNRFGVMGIELPVGFENPLERLFEVRRRMQELKKSYEPVTTLGLIGALGYGPKLVQDKLFDLLLSRATAVMTNVPGPQNPLYLGGSELKQIIFWVPQSGSIGMGLSILSFNGKVHFGLITDAAMVPDPQSIIARIEPEFERLLYFVLMQPPAAGDESKANLFKRVRKAKRSTLPSGISSNRTA
jgi:WS/DGAT/MGAT family acyltransferase